MAISFLPGEPNRSSEACKYTNWNSIQILAYLSGNNLVILTKNGRHLQTIYLPADAFALDINPVNGKIALAIQSTIFVYTPTISNFYSFNFGGRRDLDELGINWSLETSFQALHDESKINCLSWSDSCEFGNADEDSANFLGLPKEFNSHTSCELVTGSDKSLSLWRFYYKKDQERNVLKRKLLWNMRQPNPVHKVEFSPNASCIASVSFCDKLVKIWHRLSYGIDSADFELYYVPHPSVVTSLRWKSFLKNNGDVASGIRVVSSSNSSTLQPDATHENLNILKTSNSIVKLDFNRLKGSTDNQSVVSLISDKKQHNVLYTVAADSTIRVFSTYKLDTGFEICKNGEIDMYEDDQTARKDGVPKFATFLDNDFVDNGVSEILAKINGQSEQQLEEEGNILASNRKKVEFLRKSIRKKLQFLNGILRDQIELCMVFDGASSCKLYALTNLDSPVPTEMSVLKLNQKYDADGNMRKCKIKLNHHCMPCDCRSLAIYHLSPDRYGKNGEITMAIQDTFKNSIRIIGFRFSEFFSFYGDDSDYNNNTYDEEMESFKPMKTFQIGQLQDKLTGHNKSIRRLIRSNDGSSLLSTTRFNENFLWSVIPLGNNRTTLNKRSTILTKTPIIDASIWKHGEYVICLIEGKLVCYDCRLGSQYHTSITKLAPELCTLDIDTSSKAMCFFLLPELSENSCHLLAVYKDKTCKAWQVTLGSDGNSGNIKSFDIESLPIAEDEVIHKVSAVDPVGWNTSIDFIGRDVLSVISKEGYVRIFYATVTKSKICWHTKNSFMTGIVNSTFLSGSSVNKLAITNEKANKLTIWDVRLGTSEYSEEFDESIKDVDWTATQYHQAILSVGFNHYSLLYTQLRYDYTNQSPTFAKIKKVSIAEQTTHEIGDSIWMSDGLLVMGSGNQFYISDKSLDPDKDEITRRAIGTLEIVSSDIFHLCTALNGPLPLYHPQFIIQMLFTGRFALIEVVLVKLCHDLREIDFGNKHALDASLNIIYTDILAPDDEANDSRQRESYHKLLDSISGGLHSEEDTFTTETADFLMERLQKHKLPYLTGHQQITLSYTVNIMKDILLKYRHVLDYNALRYYLGSRLFQINIAKTMDPLEKTTKSITMRDINFAMHSDNKDLLFNLINEQSGMKINWLMAKRYGLPYWLNIRKLTEAMEKIARNEFLGYENQNGGKMDPSRCAIFYMALKKKKILLGLWKMASGHPEQTKMIKFLSHDFDEKRWIRAANKNAYVLMSKHRYMDAAYFFLLAKSIDDCVDVIIEKIHDVPLAIAVSRTYDQSDHSKSLKRILMREVIPKAVETNNRWYLSWCFWAFKDRGLAIQSLIKPIEEVIVDIERLIPEFKMSKTYDVHKINSANNEDPVLLVMYNSLRNRNAEYLEGAQKLKSETEFRFVVKVAAMYETMGCDWIGLLTTRNWKFTAQQNTHPYKSKYASPKIKPISSDSAKKVPNVLDQFGFGPEFNNASNSTKAKPASSKRVQPPPSTFAEPDMSAFDFGF